MDGEGDIDWYFEKGINEQSLITFIGMDTEFELRLLSNELKISDFSALFFFFCFFFFRFVTRLKHGSS